MPNPNRRERRSRSAVSKGYASSVGFMAQSQRLSRVSSAQNASFVFAHLVQPVFANGNILSPAIIIPNRAKGERQSLFLQRQAGGEISGRLGSANRGRLQK